MSSASSTCASLTICNLGLTRARCTGFTKVHNENDFTFICDLEWSDERTHSIKRTFADFQKFHQQLIRLFPELKLLTKSKLHLPTSLRENVINLFNKDKRGLAETREATLDQYLQSLLRQPERIRHSNIVLSFFEPRPTDPKPCKSHSPAEKSDSGIDLTGAQTASTQSLINPTNLSEEQNRHHNYENRSVDHDEECSMTSYSSEDDYDGESETTETDNDAFDEDYFLDVGFGELMLQNSTEENKQPTSPLDAGTESSMWCSNLDKFSNILRSSMSNLHTVTDTNHKTFQTLTSIEDECDSNAIILDEIIGQSETSETESQMNTDDRQFSDHHDSSSEDDGSPPRVLPKSHMKHYYLSTSNLHTAE